MKIAIITGASSGLGMEFAKQVTGLYKKLDEIWLISRRWEPMEQLKQALSVPVRIFDGDLEQHYVYDRIRTELHRLSPDIRILVNSAGFGKIGAADKLDIQEQTEMIDLNCKALTKLTLLCLPFMGTGSRILQIASAAAFAPQPGFAVYAATKSYVYSFSRGLGVELKDRGITVTAVCPGPVRTAFFDRAGASGNSVKNNWMSETKAVVRLALKDAVKKKSVSIYSREMKAAKLLTKCMPAAVTMTLMKKLNEQG